MHLLASEIALLEDADAAVDLAQSPADMVVLSFSDGDLAALAEAWTRNADTLPSLRLASLKKLRHPMSVDLYVDRVIAKARAVAVRCLGGLDYWRYGLERIAEVARAKGIVFIALPGDDRPDARLAALSTAEAETVGRIDAYLREGGLLNATSTLRCLAGQPGAGMLPPQPIGPIVGVSGDGAPIPLAAAMDRADATPAALVVCYRSALVAADIAPIVSLTRALEAQGLAAITVAVTSLKDPQVERPLAELIARRKPSVIINTTAFSALRDDDSSVLDAADVPVLQAVLAGSTREAWAASGRGLSATDLAMNVVLPELDGRLMSRAISFKAEAAADPRLEFACVRHEPEPSRITYVASLAAAWSRLGTKPRRERQLAIMMSDYPARGGRTGYAVGLDTAASVAALLQDLAAAGFDTGGQAIAASDVEDLLRGVGERVMIALSDYLAWLDRLPATLRDELRGTWGEPAQDAVVNAGRFEFPVLRAGRVTVLLQPDRGTAGDRKSGYHDMTVPPRHAYVALYAWLREHQRIDAIVHLGTHGTLEWLPGKALALSAGCWPEAVLGPLPVVYPFIVNNPGEAAQAKRRLGAATIGHLTPPLIAGGLSGALADLEALVEEYAAADGLDKRRMPLLEAEIIDRAWSTGLAAECGLQRGEPARTAITKLDARLCDIKELSVRDGLHVLGRPPGAEAEAALVSAIEAGARSTSGSDRTGTLTQAVAACAARESAGVIAALDGRRVAPGPAGAPSRGRADVLPTGRNLTTLDPRAIPTRTATAIGARAADEVVRRYLQDHGDYPRALVMDLWASASLRTGGDDVAQALAYLGVRPVWDGSSQRFTGVEVVPLAALSRPRIDVTLRVSGLFRDLFETQIALFDLAVRRVAEREEDDAENPLAAARKRGEDLSRVFGGAPGSFGAGVASLVLDGAWQDRAALGTAYLEGATHAFGAQGTTQGRLFRARVAEADALVHPQDDRERDILDGDGVADFAGGFAAAAWALGNDAALYHVDTSRPEAPRTRTIAEEVARVVRGRLTSPRWIAGMLRHGHRGVAEIAQGVDALYAFSATAEAVPAHLFDLTHAALIADEAVIEAMLEHNPDAAGAIAARLQDALARGLWTSRRNATARELEAVLARARRNGPQMTEAAQ